MPRKAEGDHPLTPAERQARKRAARNLEAAEAAHRLERYTFILGSIARGWKGGKPITGKDAQDRARAVLTETGVDWKGTESDDRPN
jgi:hypothetical protein